jgi:hypothetical protein
LRLHDVTAIDIDAELDPLGETAPAGFVVATAFRFARAPQGR